MRVPWLLVGLLTCWSVVALPSLNVDSPWHEQRQLLAAGIGLIAGLFIDLMNRPRWTFQLWELIGLVTIAALVATLFNHGCKSYHHPF